MTVVKLSKRYAVHDVTFDKVTLREPTYKEVYIEGLGEPFRWMPAPAGGFLRVDDPLVIDAYAQRLAVEPTAECLTEISAIDAKRIGNAICDFFIEAPETSPTPSSSGSDGTQAASSK